MKSVEKNLIRIDAHDYWLVYMEILRFFGLIIKTVLVSISIHIWILFCLIMAIIYIKKKIKLKIKALINKKSK